MKMPAKLNGPIPGENYTSDTKNYPWHRPPKYKDLDKAIEASAQKLTSKEGSIGVLTMLENGMDVASLTKAFIMSGVATGRWTVDFGLLMAGPVAHIMCLMAEAYDIPYEKGIDDKALGRAPTAPFFKELKKVDEKKAEKAGTTAMEQVPTEVKTESTGFMGDMNTTEEAY